MSADASGLMAAAVPSTRPERASRAKLVLAALLVAAAIALFYFDLGEYLSLEALQANREGLLAFTEANFPLAVVLFVGTYCVVTGLALPGAAILTLAGGFLFGGLLGTLLVNLGATTGATLAFLASRYLLRDWVESRFRDRLAPIQEGFASSAFSYLLTLRLIPLFPFFLVNVVSGLTRVRLGAYIAATSIGIIPGSFVYAYAGHELGTIRSVNEIASPNVLLALTLFGILALAPAIYRKLGKNR